MPLFHCVLTCAAVGLADITSANIVGYNTVTLSEKWTILGINFTGVDGNAMDINTAIPYAEGMTKGNGTATADQIQIQDGKGGYSIYYMSNGKNAKGGDVAGLDGKWAKDGTTAVSTDTLPAGKGAWFARKGDTVFTITVKNPVQNDAE